MKPKTNQPETPKVRQTRDLFQTPNYATDLILPYVVLAGYRIIWEPCCGQGKIVNRVNHHPVFTMDTVKAFGTDIDQSVKFDCLSYSPCQIFDAIITNPPFSLKARIAQRFIDLDRPFALLIPGDWSRWLIDAMDRYNCQLLVPSRRINYITPTGKQGKESASQFHSVWLTRYLNLKERVVFVELTKEAMGNI